jgi:hypothetical protein
MFEIMPEWLLNWISRIPKPIQIVSAIVLLILLPIKPLLVLSFFTMTVGIIFTIALCRVAWQQRLFFAKVVAAVLVIAAILHYFQR